MALAYSLEQYLQTHHAHFQVLGHPRTLSAQRTAQAAHVPGARLAKSIILEDDDGYVMAVIPATHRLALGALHRRLGRSLGLAVEAELTDLFTDCEPGAVPPVGPAYGMKTVVDDSLWDAADVYLEAGDHESLLHMTGEQFRSLMHGATHGPISHHV